MIATAPGKILLAGEYAVLEGGEAVVMAVDRRVRARIGEEAATASPFLAAAARVVEEELGPERGALVARVSVDSAALCDPESGAKLGLGSSAAAVTAAIAACLPPPGDRKLLHRLAHRAHAAAQAGAGSGADVAASVWGGVLRLGRPDRSHDPLRVAPLVLPAGLVFVPVWLGRPADTRALVAEMTAFARREPDACRAFYARIARAAAELADASRVDLALAALWEASVAARELGAAAGVEVVTEQHRALDERAQALGGLVKATGAGGGDIALGAFPGPEAAEHFRGDATSLGMKVLDLSVDPAGARLEPEAHGVIPRDLVSRSGGDRSGGGAP